MDVRLSASPGRAALQGYYEHLATLHDVLCPRQVLGLRMALLAGELLDVPFPQADKRVVVMTEMDGCFIDGIVVVTNCTVGHRTMRVSDLGKTAATFVDSRTGRALRVWPQPEARERSVAYAPGAESRWHAYRDGYAVMPATELLLSRWVELTEPTWSLISAPESRVSCAGCGEEVLNGRHVLRDGQPYCGTCAGEGYVAN